MNHELKVQQDILMREMRSYAEGYNDAVQRAKDIGVHPSVSIDEDGMVDIAAFWLELKG